MKTEDLPLIKAIRASNKLSLQKKTAVIKKIDRIFRSRDEKKKCGFCRKARSLWGAFMWYQTKEGQTYWYKVCNTLED